MLLWNTVDFQLMLFFSDQRLSKFLKIVSIVNWRSVSYIIIQCTIGATTVQRRELHAASIYAPLQAISLRFEQREYYLREGVERSGSPRKATAIQATGMRFTSRGFAWNERWYHDLTLVSQPDPSSACW